jgi:hypothetical protein
MTMERPKILPHEEHKRLTERGSGSLQPDCCAALSRLLIASANTSSIAGAWFSVENPKRGKLVRDSLKQLDKSCADARKVLKQHNARTEPPASKP